MAVRIPSYPHPLIESLAFLPFKNSALVAVLPRLGHLFGRISTIFRRPPNHLLQLTIPGTSYLAPTPPSSSMLLSLR